MRKRISIGPIKFKTYPVTVQRSNVIVCADEFQGDCYWLFILIVFNQGFSIQIDGKTKGGDIYPFYWKLFK